MINTKKRDYCLLGQQFLRNVCAIELNDTMIFIDKNKLRQKLFLPPENCEDNEHGGRDLFNFSDKSIDIDEHYY